MKETTGRKRAAWFWAGIALLTISGLLWLLLIAVIVDEPQDTGWVLLIGIILTAIPIALGVYCVKPGTQKKQGIIKAATYALAIVPLALKYFFGEERTNRFKAGVILLFLSAVIWLFLLIGITAAPENTRPAILVGIIVTSLPVGLGIYWVRRVSKQPPVEIKLGHGPTDLNQSTEERDRDVHRRTEPVVTQPKMKPARTYTGFLGRITEKLRDKTRDKLCAGLWTIGVDARMAERGRPEEKIGRGSLGLIDIDNGPIRWVNIRKERVSIEQGGGWVTYYYTEYGVPDSRIEPNFSKLRINSVRVKTFLGQVVDLRWKGNDLHLGIMGRLHSDTSIKDAIMGSHDLTIQARADHGCWLIVTITRDAPSGELWGCYQAIAGHLLADWATNQ